jgi:uncharacterized protein
MPDDNKTDKPPDDAEMLEPDADPAPPPRAQRSQRRRDDDEYDDRDRDRRDDEYHPRGRKVHYDEDGYEITSDHSMWALFCHIGVFAFGFISPLVILIVFRQRSPFVVRHAKESLNHQITLTLLVFLFMAVGTAIGFGVYLATQDGWAGFIVGYALAIIAAFAIGILNTVTLILATIAAAKYREYRYPFTMRLIG